MILTQILKQNSKKFPSVPALTMRMGFRTVTLTYKDVYDVSLKIALLLQHDGVKKGDAVLLLAPNSPYWGCVFWGCMLAGVVAVPLNVQSTPQLVEKIAKQVKAKLFFAHRYYRHEMPNDMKRYNVDLIMEELKTFDENRFEWPLITDDDLVEILYTSGTTGDPKGVLLTHKNLYTNIDAVSQMISLEVCKERLLSILPLSHIFEQVGGFLLPFYYVAHIVYAPSHAAIRDLLNEYRITKMMSVPEFLKLFMAKIEGVAHERGREVLLKKMMNISLKINNKFISRLLFSSILKKFGGKLDAIVCGGAPLDPELEKKWNALGIVLFQAYGLTETSPIITSNTFIEHRFESVGKVAPGVHVRISPDGEIQVKGPNVFSGYFKNDEKTKESFTPDGWFKTGDMGEFDKDGFLFLRGRKKYMILGSGGQNVFPEDIEQVLSKIDGVKDSTVVGIEQPAGMIQIHAVFLSNDSMTMGLSVAIEISWILDEK